MNKVILAIISLAVVSSVHIHEDMKPIVEYINSIETTWTAGLNERHSGFTMDSLKAQCGSLPEDVHSIMPNMVHDLDDASVPTSFDSREQWPTCDSIKEVRDQSACGSCWAHGAVEAMSDRICIGSGGKDQTRISAEDLMSCCILTCGFGCSGGFPSGAWSYYKNSGIVSGGLYDDNTKCWSYPFPPCAHHTTSAKYPDCPTKEYSAPSCKKECQSDSSIDYSSDKRKGTSHYSISGVANIQKEIMTNGPIEVSFTVYADFEAYKSGVYEHKTGSELGGHAVKMIGWGEESGTPYWIVANSWNESWGDAGFFKIIRGKNECGIESSAVAGAPPKSDLFLN